MSFVKGWQEPLRDHPPSFEEAALQLLHQSLIDPLGDVSVSIYETAAVVRQAPAMPLDYHRSLAVLIHEQRADGSWGGPGLYSVVPTLAATAAMLWSLLQVCRGEWEGGVGTVTLAQAALDGLGFLEATMHPAMVDDLPDTVAVELVVPALVADIHEALNLLADSSFPDSDIEERIRKCLAIRLPVQDNRRLLGIRDLVRKGGGVPSQIHHCLEVLGDDARFLRRSHLGGVVGCSPGATASMLPHRSTFRMEAFAYLRASSVALEGGYPSVAPIAQFERSWVVHTLLHADIPLPDDVVTRVVAYCHASLGPRGTGAGDGLPEDADDTAVMLSILSRLGSPASTDVLLLYEADTHFRCFEGERNPSVSANAHVLEAFTDHLAAVPTQAGRYAKVIRKLAEYLIAEQSSEGSWHDKWHASPFYATWCSVLALRNVPGFDCQAILGRAAAWVLAAQRPDGSWGRWWGTLEETAYALMILGRSGSGWVAKGSAAAAIVRGRRFLLKRSDAAREDRVHASLWHDKELYSPRRVVRSAVLAALHMSVVPT